MIKAFISIYFSFFHHFKTTKNNNKKQNLLYFISNVLFQSSMAISMKDLQSVHLKKTESLGPSKKSEPKKQDPIKQLLKKSSKGEC